MDERQTKLAEIISYLISLGHEGTNWDFKREWHTDEVRLLHDIICMANNPKRQDSYIIIGVTNSGEVVNIEDDSNRRDTQRLHTFLKEKKFYGDIRPQVRVESVLLDGCNLVDVIIINDSLDVPFILAEDYVADAQTGKITAPTKLSNPKDNRNTRIYKYAVYMRGEDSNTDIDKTADRNDVERLWRKHFMIDSTPMEKLLENLRHPKDWMKSPYYYQDDTEIYYYKFDPLCTIEIGTDMDKTDHGYLSKLWIDNSATGYYTIRLKAYGIVIAELKYLCADSFKFQAVQPYYYVIPRCQGSGWQQHIFLTFMIENSLPYRLDDFVQEHLASLQSSIYAQGFHWHDAICIFRSDDEFQDFKGYVQSHYDSILEYINSKNSGRKINDFWTQDDEWKLMSSVVIKQVLDDWRIKQYTDIQ